MGLRGERGLRIEAVWAVDDKSPNQISDRELPVGAEFDAAPPSLVAASMRLTVRASRAP